MQKLIFKLDVACLPGHIQLVLVYKSIASKGLKGKASDGEYRRKKKY